MTACHHAHERVNYGGHVPTATTAKKASVPPNPGVTTKTGAKGPVSPSKAQTPPSVVDPKADAPKAVTEAPKDVVEALLARVQALEVQVDTHNRALEILAHRLA